VDDEGVLHREGVMRLATARDEIEPLRDSRVKDNEAYATVIVLAKVVTELGTVSRVNTRTIERLFASDYRYLQDFYRVINFGGSLVALSRRRRPRWADSLRREGALAGDHVPGLSPALGVGPVAGSRTR
jgi:hypothetical protein